MQNMHGWAVRGYFMCVAGILNVLLCNILIFVCVKLQFVHVNKTGASAVGVSIHTFVTLPHLPRVVGNIEWG
jgi:hypothetical protein